MKQRLQKVLAELGHGSRRQIEKLIDEGKVKVNRQVVELGCKVKPGDWVELPGKRLKIPAIESHATPKVLLYHKPEGEICTRNDPEGRRTVFQVLPRLKQARWVAVGRLDFNTAGLLLFTNDGELANKLMHPSAQLERVYMVRVQGTLTRQALQAIQTGIKEDGEILKAQSIQATHKTERNSWYRVVLTEGKNREIRRLFASQDVAVNRLIRVQYGPIKLPRDLRKGRYMNLNVKQVEALLG